MKTIDTSLRGGMPVKLDDFAWIQDNIAELRVAMAEAVNEDIFTTFIFHGAKITVTGSGGATPVFNITAGWLYKDGEIYEVEAREIYLQPGYTYEQVMANYYFDVNTTASSPRVFVDGTTKNVHIRKVVTVTNNPINWPYGPAAVPLTTKRYSELIRERANGDISDRDYRFANTLTSVANISMVEIFRQIELMPGQHLVRLYTPVGYNTTICKIVPPAGVWEGYEVTVEIKRGLGSTRGLKFTRQNYNGLIIPNLNLMSHTIPYNNTVTGKVEIKRTVDYAVTYNTSGVHLDMYNNEFGEYDYGFNNGLFSGSFKLVFRWNSRTNMWDEVARMRYLS